MPKYYCDYCDTFLTHDSPSVRKTHNGGRKHKENVRMFYQKWMEDQAQKLVDETARAFAVSQSRGGQVRPLGPPMMVGALGRALMPQPVGRPVGFTFPGAVPFGMNPMGVNAAGSTMPPVRPPAPFHPGARFQ